LISKLLGKNIMKELPDFFIGVDYEISPDMLEEEIIDDIAAIAGMGFQCVQISTASLALKNKKKEICRLQELLYKEIKTYGLGVIVDLSTVFQSDSFVDTQLDDSLFPVRKDGRVDFETGEINLNNPKVRESVKENLKTNLEAHKGQENLWAYQVWNGQGFHHRFDTFSIQLFQKWLEEKWSAIAELNQALDTGFSDFNQVDPRPRRDSNCGIDLAWMQFLRQNQVDIIIEFNAFVKEEAPEIPTIVLAKGSMVYPGNQGRGTDDWLNSGVGDYGGLDYFPKAGVPNSVFKDMPWLRLFPLACIHSNTKKEGFIVHIASGPQNSLDAKTALKSEDIKTYLNECHSMGARGIMLSQWRPRRSGIKVGALGISWRPDPPSKQLREARQFIQKNKSGSEEKISRITKSPSPYGILYDPANEEMLRAIGANLEKDVECELYNNAIAVYFRLFESLKTSVSIYRPEHLNDLPSGLKHLIVPCQIRLSKDLHEGLLGFLGKGGHVFWDSALLALDENGRLLPEQPYGPFTQYFGVKFLGIENGPHGIQATDLQVNFQASRARCKLYQENDDIYVSAVYADHFPAVMQTEIEGGQFTCSTTALGLAHLDKAQAQLRSYFKFLFEMEEKDQEIKL